MQLFETLVTTIILKNIKIYYKSEKNLTIKF